MDCHKKHQAPGGISALHRAYGRAVTVPASEMSLFVFLVANPSAASALSAPFAAQLPES